MRNKKIGEDPIHQNPSKHRPLEPAAGATTPSVPQPDDQRSPQLVIRPKTGLGVTINQPSGLKQERCINRLHSWPNR